MIGYEVMRSMTDFLDDVPLREGDMAALQALRSGAATTTEIAMHAKLSLPQARSALIRLAGLGLALRPSDGRRGGGKWALTAAGSSARPVVGARCAKLGRSERNSPEVESVDEAPVDEAQIEERRHGSVSQRLLAALTRPKSGAVLARELGQDRETLRQWVVRLASVGRIKVADPSRPSRWLALASDPTPLFPAPVERLLSAFDEGSPTTVTELAQIVRSNAPDIAPFLDLLEETGLVRSRRTELGLTFVLTDAGRAHPQRRASRQRAERSSLSVRSDLERIVLALLGRCGPLRKTDLCRRLGLETRSVDTTVRSLTRRGLVAKTGDALFAPHAITRRGRVALEMWALEEST